MAGFVLMLHHLGRQVCSLDIVFLSYVHIVFTTIVLIIETHELFDFWGGELGYYLVLDHDLVFILIQWLLKCF